MNLGEEFGSILLMHSFLQPLEGFGISQVIHSDDPNFHPGEYVSGITGWEEYSLIQNKNRQLRKIEFNPKMPLSYQLGLLGKSLEKLLFSDIICIYLKLIEKM